MSTIRLTNSQIQVVRDQLAAAQGGRCAICKKALAGAIATLDHNHQTGFCRGVLCNNCNGMEGRISKLATRAKYNLSTLQWLRNLVAYLEFHSIQRTNMMHPTHKTPEQKRVIKNQKARDLRAKAKSNGTKSN